MPIDIASIFSNNANRLANRSSIGYIIGHPIWFSLIIVTTIVIMLSAWGLSEWNFKFLFYLGGSILALMTAHDWILGAQYKEKNTNTGLQNIVQSSTQGGFAIPPRPATELRNTATVTTIDPAKSDLDLLLSL